MSSQFLAVVGMAGRFPGAPDVEAFWSNLASGIESAAPAPGGGGFAALEGADLFDADYFGYSPLEALTMDPQHRLLLECAVEALEHAGHDPRSYRGAIGVYAGASQTPYLDSLHRAGDSLASASEYQLRLATGTDFLTTRVTYKLDLRGPGVTVLTACSTSLVAIHLAGQALLAGECDVALAGGVCAHVPPPAMTGAREGGILSPDGHCRAFDAAASGTVGGNAVGLVVLRRLDDALAEGDHVHAVMRGSAINNDGAGKVGYTAPSVDGQARAIVTAHTIAEVEPDTIAYVEAHGTGTPVGDPIEVAALVKAFGAGTDRRQFCLIGSVKTNIGHTDAAAGVAGFIKTALALERGLIPRSLNYAEPNPECDFPNTPFRVATELGPWPAASQPRRAGVSSFGIGGTNAHVVLEEAPAPAPSGPARPLQLLPLSARTPHALEAVTDRLAAHLQRHPNQPLADVAWTLQVGRQAHARRRFVVAGTPEAARRALAEREPRALVTGAREPQAPSVAFLFPGQGGQHVGMARDLYEHEPAFREHLDECADLAAPRLGFDLRDVLYPAGDEAPARGRLASMSVGQPAVFAVEYALAGLWMRWGVAPAAVAGHSLGAYAAACVAGTFALADAVGLVVERGRLLESVPAGAMLAVPLAEAEVAPLLGGDLTLAAINGPRQCVVSGPAALVDELRGRLERQGVEARRLHIATAGHSTLVEPVLDEFRGLVAGIGPRAPRLPWVSDLTGGWISPDEAASPGYWADHMRQPVRFADVLATLLAEPGRVLVEVGPGHTLATLARQHPALRRHLVVSSLPHPAERTSALASALGAAGHLWLAGAPVRWAGLHEGQSRRRVVLPTYPFERRRFALEVTEPAPAPGLTGIGVVTSLPGVSAAPEPIALFPRPETGTRYRRPRTPGERAIAKAFAQALGIREIGIDDNFFELGGDSLIAARLVARLRDSLKVDVPARQIFEAPTVRELAAGIEVGGTVSA